MTDGLRIDHYEWAGGREAMLRFGLEGGPLVVAALPLFEEANRTRAFVVAVLRALAQAGIGSVLPDLPGQGESLVETKDAALFAMRAAYAALTDQLGAERPIYGLGVRSGCLLDEFARLDGRWHLAPVTGGEVLREFWRVKQANTPERRSYDRAELIGGEGETLEAAGNLLSRDRMLAPLADALPYAPDSRTRVARLANDPRTADVRLPGAPLWRRAEPGNDLALVHMVEADIVRWISTCAA